MKTQTPLRAKITMGAAATLFAAVCAVLPAHAQTELITNGGFETGDFSGWTNAVQMSPQTSAAGFFIGDNTQSPVLVEGDGMGNGDVVLNTPTTPINGLPTVGAHSGNFYAVTDSDGAANAALLQSFTVPTGATSVKLSFLLFVNTRNGAGAQNTTGPLDYRQVTPTQFARVDLLSSSATPFSLGAGNVLANFYIGADPTAGPNPLYPTPYTLYANRDLTPFVVPGGTYKIRIAEVSNEFIVNTGVDDVSILATGPLAAAPEPASLLLALVGLAVLGTTKQRRRQKAHQA